MRKEWIEDEEEKNVCEDLMLPMMLTENGP